MLRGLYMLPMSVLLIVIWDPVDDEGLKWNRENDNNKNRKNEKRSKKIRN